MIGEAICTCGHVGNVPYTFHTYDENNNAGKGYCMAKVGATRGVKPCECEKFVFKRWTRKEQRRLDAKARQGAIGAKGA